MLQFVFHCLNHRTETHVQPEGGSASEKHSYRTHGFSFGGSYEEENNESHSMINN